MDIEIIKESIPAIAQALPTTLALVSISLFFGFFFGCHCSPGTLKSAQHTV